MVRFLYILLTICVLSACSSKGSAGKERGDAPDGDTLTHAAELLTLVAHDGWTMAELTNPWDETAKARRYALVERDSEVPAGLGEDVTVVRVPVERSVVTSSVFIAAIDELGATGSIAGVTDAEYVATASVKAAMASGKIADVGTSASPTLETIIEISPDVVLATPYAESDHSAMTKMKITVMEMADYMEKTPQGRAEWFRLIGRLYGRGAEADSIYERSMAEYERLRLMAAGMEARPKVITEQVMSGTWYVPGGGSYMARLLTDAGAEYPFSDDSSAGSLALDFATVLDRAGDADYWLLKTYGTDVTLRDLKADYELNGRMKAWQTGEVYAANTAACMMYEEFPFHPERLLADYMRIFHRTLTDSLPEARYFHKVRP